MPTPDRPPSRSQEALRPFVARALAARTFELTERWHAQLEERLRIRPRNVFPGSTLLDGMPAVIEWIAMALANGRELTPEQTDPLHALAEHWRRSGYTVEESLLHLGVLGEILNGAAREELERFEGSATAADGALLAERICAALGRVESVLVGGYRDEEEGRIADFGGTLAHEIRGDLSTAAAAAELLSALEPGGEGRNAALRREAIERISGAVRQAGRLIESVHTFSRARAGIADWTMRPLGEVVEEVVERVRERSAEQVKVEVVDDVPGVRVPAEAVRLILHNLLENAVRYADPNKEDCWTRIHVREDEARGHWVVQVGDNGQGIPEEEQERIFARFLRGRQAEGSGFGLGLAIARQAALSIGGSLLLEGSKPGEGTTFSVTIPFAATGAGQE